MFKCSFLGTKQKKNHRQLQSFPETCVCTDLGFLRVSEQHKEILFPCPDWSAGRWLAEQRQNERERDIVVLLLIQRKMGSFLNAPRWLHKHRDICCPITHDLVCVPCSGHIVIKAADTL
ncbi:hypothetical protein XELAEV_18008483mg [Xenopus laevis]|uniref:Uncharacterized protein n=1 Tax=Xenopus laevis TaxID=8355 RepID=A0A974E455_XENLA|nr:hypothetical protein XELAEV_18008483mg [Xenopus laevis]